jgi:hypothetical protein
MEAAIHRFSELFAQLGLPAGEAAIAAFIAEHAPLAGGMRLEDAPFWSAAQAALLRELIAADADWAELADQLNAVLHKSAGR